MTIGIEAERANIQNLTGVEHYAKSLILALAEIDRQNNYVLYLRTRPQSWILSLPHNFKYKVIPFPIFWTQLRISWEMLTNPVDALFIMASALPLIHPKNSMVTIHDIAWEFYPETFGKFMLYYLKFSTWFACKFARSIIAVSNQTKQDLIGKYGLKPEKITVIHHGFDMSLENELSDFEESAKIKALPEKFVISLSTLQPRKNIIGLVDAFIELKKEKNIPHSLVLAGGKGWLYDQIMEKITGHPEVIYFGYVHNRFALLKKADLLVQPAFYEGFGLQLLDAFAVGVPVACSNVSSLPEVAEDAAIYFDPYSKEEIKESIYRALTDQDLRKRLVDKGSERIKNFNWKVCAEKTLRVLEHV